MMSDLLSLPSDWWWSVDKLPRTKRVIVRKGKKKVELPYQVYICNGALIGTRGFASATADGDDILDALRRAVSELHRKVEELAKDPAP